MPLTEPIQGLAMKMVRIIRKEVPRPKELPRKRWGSTYVLGHFGFVRRGQTRVTSCPMGLIPGATPTPWSPEDLPKRIEITPLAIMDFGDWWDEQCDARAALDAVWPKKKSRVAKKK